MHYRFDIGDVDSNAEKKAVFFIGQSDGKKVVCSVSWEILRTYFSDGEDEEEDPLMYNPFWWYFNNQHVFQQKAEELINIGRFEKDGSIVLDLQDVYQEKELENENPNKPRIARQKKQLDGIEPGLVKGTQVHTKEGKLPIEQVKIGDYVLSSPEDGSGKPEYKRVKNVFRHKEKTIRHVSLYGPDPQLRFTLGATENHSFWVEGRGWTRADKLQKDQVLRKADGSAEVARQLPVYRTGRDGVGWIQMLSNVEGSSGTVFDFENFAIVPLGQDEYLSEEVYKSDDPFLEVTVYSLEVEDFHTYYVCSEAYWVHD